MAEPKKYRVCRVEVPFILIGLLLVLFVTTVGTIVAVIWKWRQDQVRVVNPILAEVPSVEVLYVSNIGDNTIRAFDLTGRDLGIFASTLSGAYALASDGIGNLYAAEVSRNVIEIIDASGASSVFASSGLHGPDGLVVDPSGHLYVASYSKNQILKFETNDTSSVLADTGLAGPARLALDTNGDLYVANFANNSIVKFEASGTSSVFASTGLSQPTCLAFDRSGQLYVANYGNNTIVKFALNHTPSVFARSGLSAPTSMAFDRSGNLYVANSGNNTVVRFDTNGIPTTFASAGLKTPYGLAVVPRRSSANASPAADAPTPEASQRAPRPVDLSRHYNADLTNAWHFRGGRGSATLRDLPQGVQEFGGIPFEVRRLVQLASARTGGNPSWPEQVTDIPLGLRCRSLHFLHATGWVAPDGTPIGSYFVHYADGSTVEIPIVYGQHLREWHGRSDRNPEISDGSLAWNDQKPGTKRRLFQCRWENPKPGVELRTVDFVSAMTDCFPFLIAITAE